MSNAKMIVQRLLQAINAQDPDAIGELLSDGYHSVDESSRELLTKKTAIHYWQQRFKGFPDYTLEIDELIAEDNKVMGTGFITGTNSGKPVPMAFRADLIGEQVEQSKLFVVPGQHRPSANSIHHEDQLAVQGLGGVFFKAKDPKALGKWYDDHLGTRFGKGHASYFKWRERDAPENIGSTSYSIFSETSDYYAPSIKPFMLNFRVKNLDALMEKLKFSGVPIVGEIDRYDYGNFGWIMDPEGNKIELWQPVDSVLDAYEEEQEKKG